MTMEKWSTHVGEPGSEDKEHDAFRTTGVCGDYENWGPARQSFKSMEIHSTRQ